MTDLERVELAARRAMSRFPVNSEPFHTMRVLVEELLAQNIAKRQIEDQSQDDWERRHGVDKESLEEIRRTPSDRV